MVIKQKYLIEFQIYYLLIVEALIDLLHFPDIIRYVLDVNAIVLIILALPKIRDMLNDKFFKGFNSYVFIYMIAIAGFSLIRRTPVGQILWAVRNNYFYILFMLICAYTLKPKDLQRILKNIVFLQAFNVACVLYEYLIQRQSGDNLGGMFGTEFGCNGYLNVYLAIITAYVIVGYANRKVSLFTVLMITLSSMAIAVLSELKFYFFELVVIVILAITLSSLNAKNGMLVIVTVLAIFVGIQILSAVNPMSAELLRDFDSLNDYTKTSYDDQIIARGTPFSQINDYFFNGNLFYNLFGYGFGACESSETLRWANSAFANKYGYLQYRNLSTSMNFIETGFIGLIAFVAIFVLVFVYAQNQKQKYENIRHAYVFTQVVSIIAIMNIWYNSTIRREIAYLTFFCLSAFIVYSREKAREELKKNTADKPVKRSYFKNKRV